MTSLRLVECPECESTSVEVERLEENNCSLNVRGKVTCQECGHVWEDQVSNSDRRDPWLLRR